jgi:xylose isomerase
MTLAQELKIAARVCALKRLAHRTSAAYAALETELLERLREGRLTAKTLAENNKTEPIQSF